MLMLILIEVKKNFEKILGSLLDNLGRKEEALIDFSKVIDINPHDADAYYNRGRNYF